jgi:hypothetical protein
MVEGKCGPLLKGIKLPTRKKEEMKENSQDRIQKLKVSPLSRKT